MKIPLLDALGVSPNTPSVDIATRWTEWKLKYPQEADTLSPAVVISMDAFAALVISFVGINQTYTIAKQTFDTAMTVYNLAMMAPPLTPISTKDIAKVALDSAQGVVTTFFSGVQESAKTAVEQLTNSRVDDKTSLKA
jgi:hypothetical protein